MENGQGNSLAQASSAYLRSARDQPVQWREWGAEAFAAARRENKPVLLDIGAVWCHWCHVMDRESYEDGETAALINEKYIAVKVDRDERPDVDTRYQSAVASISGQGGWPLTAFLTPEGKPYFGGTYFPPDERYGRPSFKRVLLTMADAFQNQRDEVDESAGSVLEAIEHNETFSAQSETPGEQVLAKLTASIIAQFDARNGGFGSQPKFPHSGALDLLMDAATRGSSGAEAAQHVVVTSLRKMADGGIHDQLAGGFHRYSVDERWVVPHFEKMAYDNSELLQNYVHAFQTFLLPEFAAVARDIIGWMDEWLSDRDKGGFYSSQDADDSLDDDGDYFTWSRAEAKAVLTSQEFEAVAAYYNLRDVGDMHHNPQKNVLHIVTSLAETATSTGMSEAELKELLVSAKAKMYAARRLRRTPYIDRTMYAGWNGMCISAYLEAARVLGMEDVKQFALKSLNRLLTTAWSNERGLSRVIAYGETSSSNPIAGVLDDYAFVANAALDAWESTGEMHYAQTARDLADFMLTHFYDEVGRGFFDAKQGSDIPIGALIVRRKPIQDSPTPAGNATAATVLLRLSALFNDGQYAARAKQTLDTFSGVVEHLSLYAASYGLALVRLTTPAVQVCIVGDDGAADVLLAAATAGYAANKSVIRLTRGQLIALPPSLAETLPYLPRAAGSFAVVCQGNTCLPPIQDADKLSTVLNASAAN